MTTGDKTEEKKAKKPRIFFLLGLIVTTGYLTFFSVKATEPALNRIKLPPGFSIAPYATGIDNARSIPNASSMPGTDCDKSIGKVAIAGKSISINFPSLRTVSSPLRV